MNANNNNCGGKTIATQKQETYTVIYGVAKGYNKGNERFFVMCDGRETSMHYAKKDFALKKAYVFCKECYKDFIGDRDNTEIHLSINI